MHDMIRDPGRRFKVGLLLSTMWTIKDYILSGVLKELNKNYDIVLWIPQIFSAGVQHLLFKLQCTHIEVVEYYPPKTNKGYDTICKLQKSFLYEKHDVETERIRLRRSKGIVFRPRTPTDRLANSMMRLFAKSPARDGVERALEKLRDYFVSNLPGKIDLNQYGIDLMFITDPVNNNDYPFYLACLRNRIPLVTLVMSWDNLTSKGVIGKAYKKVMVWNEIMRKEVLNMYPSYGADQVVVTGYPRFDIYQDDTLLLNIPAFLESMGLNSNGRLLVYANSGTPSFKTQPQIIQDICDALKQGLFPKDTQLLIRCHPHDDISLYSHFRSMDKVAVWPPSERIKEGTLFQQLPQEDDLIQLALTFLAADVCINAGSTVMLDAALCNKPIICVAYNGGVKTSLGESYASVYGYTHQKPLHAVGATEICYNKEELIKTIQKALNNPKRLSKERKEIVDIFLGGKHSAAPKIKLVIDELLSKKEL